MDYEKDRKKARRKPHRYTLMVVPDSTSGIREYELKWQRYLAAVGILVVVLIGLLWYSISAAGRMHDLKAANAQLTADVQEQQAQTEKLQQELDQVKTQAEGQAQQEAEQAAAAQAQEVEASVPRGYPLKGISNVVHTFGAYENEDGEAMESLGMVLSAEEGMDVLASGDGTVIFAGDDEELGKAIKIDHGHGYVSIYGYNKELKVQEGDQVTKGQVIAAMGSGDNGIGMLEYRVTKDDQYVDPQELLDIAG